MTTTAERLRIALEARSMKQSELALRTGIGKSSISTYLTGAYLPKQRNIYKMAHALDVNEAWLMGLDVPMERAETVAPETVIPAGFDPMPDMASIPLVGQIACGQPITAEENLEGYISAPERWHADFALICRGKSMEPKIHDGDLVAIRAGLQIENGQVAAVRIDNEATLKRVYRYPERLILRPINEDFEEIVLEGEEINRASIEGKAVGLCRDI